MASSILLRRSSNLLNKFANPLRSVSIAPSINRSFNTNSLREYVNEDEHNVDINRRPSSGVRSRRDSPPSFFSDVFDPVSVSLPTRSLSQILNLMDHFAIDPVMSPSGGIGGGLRRGWNAKEDNDGLHLRIDMPGLDKEDVKVSVEQNRLTIKGEAAEETEDEESARRYSSRIDIPLNVYKIDQIKAEMKNGVLKVFVPKVKEEERNDVVQVKVD
ncbi:Heat shock protein [Thalictrum thalictroides]|uniref:Heat shock protein n=1 Tax=Thalictrum thalictroides TaxID=46969 RepID=A0A7J6VPG6_THATH|nr:Heat shock protein [Thalictrum thalictroides]